MAMGEEIIVYFNLFQSKKLGNHISQIVAD